jgi:hypothetical protein
MHLLGNIAVISASVTIMLFNPRFARAFCTLSSNKRRIFHSSSSLKVARNIRGKITMWGEGPGENNNNNNKPSIPSRNSGTDRIQVDGDGRRIRGGRASVSDTFSSSPSRSRGAVYDDWGNDVRASPRKKEREEFDDDWGQDVEDDWGGGRKSNAGRKKEFQSPRSSKSKSFGNHNNRRDSNSRNSNRRDGNSRRITRDNQGREDDKDASELKINLKALEKAGFVHLYGLAPVINALTTKKRDLVSSDSYVDLDMLDGEDLQHELRQRERKPEAQYTPWLFIQENMKFGSGGKTADKAAMAKQVEMLAKESNVPVAYVDKGILNTLCGSRPHQVRVKISKYWNVLECLWCTILTFLI